MAVDVLIIGAGLSGLTAAQELHTAGYSITVLDKGRSVGGRMATRRIGPGRADHGAQFFTVRETAFAKRVSAWEQAGLVGVWGYGWSQGSHDDVPADGHPRYVATGGMNALTKHMADQLPGEAVRVSTRVTAVSPQQGGWLVKAGEASWQARALLITAPVPQSLALVEGVALQQADRDALEKISYGPCLCGLFWVEGALTLPAPGAVQRPDAAISWMADNQAKGISPAAQLITVHASPTWSRDHFEDEDSAAVLDALFAALEPYISGDVTIHERQLKKWRYAIPQSTHPQRVLMAGGLPPLAFAGDAFGGPRVEGAVLSGLAAAAALSARL